MNATLISLFDVIINGIGLIAIGVLIYQFCKERKIDMEKKSNARKIQLGKPFVSIWNGSEDDIEIKLNNKDHESDIWLVETQFINSLVEVGLDHYYYVHLRLPNNRFVTKAEVKYWRNTRGVNAEGSELVRYDPHDLGTISPDKGYILPIQKSDDLFFFIYGIEYSNEINEEMQFIVIAVVDTTTGRIIKRYDILCLKKNGGKSKPSELFPSTSWDELKGALDDKIVGSLRESALSTKQLNEWEFSLVETSYEHTCSAKVLKQKLDKLQIL